MTKFSIITVCKNEPEVELTAKSVVAQTFKDFEWIVIDGGSEDNTLEILEKYRSRMAHFVSEKDSGIYNAMNKGINLAKGEYLIFLNGGDEFYDERILADFDGTADVVYGNAMEIGEQNQISKLPSQISPDYFIYSRLLHQSTFIKRTLFERFGKYREDLKIVSDWEKCIVFQRNDASFEKIEMIASKIKRGGISTNKTFKRFHQQERANVLREHFSDKEIKNCYKNFPPKFIERIYSLKNEGTCKVVRLLFFTIRIDFRFFR